MLPVLSITEAEDFAVVVFKKEILKKIRADTFYGRMLEGRLHDRAIARVAGSKLLRWLQFVANSLAAFWKYRRHDQFFFEYGRSGREKNVLIALLVLSGRARRIVFYPHGHAVNLDSDYAEARWPPITRYAVKHGARIIRLDGSALDPRFVGIRYPILHPKWKGFVRAHAPQLYQDHVVILSRDVHRDYLLEANRSQMLADAVEVLSECFPGSRIVIRAHPREIFAAQSLQISGRAVEVTYENTYSVVRGARLAISFWTSAFFQCLALDVPAVEYHLAHDRFRSLYPDGSLYRAFIPCFHDKADLLRYAAVLSRAPSPPP